MPIIKVWRFKRARFKIISKVLLYMILRTFKVLTMATEIKHNKIAIIIPAYNEHQNIQRLINQLIII